MMESDFTVVENDNMLDKLFLEVDDFHDSFIKEVSLFTDSYIDENGVWHNDLAPHNARLLIQSQSPKVRSLELVFLNVKTINMRCGFDLIPSGTIKQNEVMVSFAEKPYENEFRIIAKQLKYRTIDRR
ncbi:MAG: hypothetical protein FWH21_00715 [Kiritimatiellaeota bacterium]|nr:hypothetical protein [Kiritimatiellota bacterium]